MKYSEAPLNIKKIFAMMIGYATIVAVGALVNAIQTELSDPREFIHGAFRVISFVIMSFWLLSGQKQAWWFAVISCILLACLGILGLIVFSALSLTHGLDLFRLILAFILGTYLLSHAAILLLKGETRSYFT